MNKILTIALAVISAAALFSCKEEAPEPKAPEITVFLQALPEAMTFGYDDADIQSITVIALNTGWRAEVESSAQEWLKITVESNNVHVRVEENTVEEPRAGKITIIPDDKTLNPVEINVTQSLSEAIRITATSGKASFEGDQTFSYFRGTLKTGLSRYWLYISEASWGSWRKNGYLIFLELFADEITPRDYQVIELKPGKYNMSMDSAEEQFGIEKWTCMRTEIKRSTIYYDSQAGATDYNWSGLKKYEEGKVIENIALTAGWVVIEEKGGDYSVSAEFISDRGQKIVIDFPGPFNRIENEY